MKNFIVLVLTIVSFSFDLAFVPNAVQAQAVYIPLFGSILMDVNTGLWTTVQKGT